MSRQPRKLAATIAAFTLFGAWGVAPQGDVTAAGGCVGYATTGWTSSHAYYTVYASDCDWLRVKAAYSQPGVGYTWSDYQYDYTVGDAYIDYNVRNYPQWTPVLNADGSSYVS